MTKSEEQKILRRVFCEICDGFSPCEVWGEHLFIKHFSHRDQVSIENLRERAFEKAVKNGKLSIEEAKKNAIKEGYWTQEKENLISSANAVIENLEKSKRASFLNSQVKVLNERIDKEYEKLKKLLEEKNAAIGDTADSYADSVVNEFCIVASFYKDEDCKIKRFDPRNYSDELYEEDIMEISTIYNLKMFGFEEKWIKKLAIQDFFQVYWGLADDKPKDFYGKQICDLSFFQIKLSNYGRVYRQILQKLEKIPEPVRDDPDKLWDFFHMQEKAREKKNEARQKTPGVSAISMVGEEVSRENLGPNEISLCDEIEKIKQKTGTTGRLSKADTMRLMGIMK